MKDNSSKIILILIFIIIILGCVFIFKVLNGNNHERQIIAKVNFSKSEIIDLIKSEKNKSNYEVEYTKDDIKFKRKYLNRKMKLETSSSDENLLCYFDFEKDTTTIIKEDTKTVIIQKISQFNENYMPSDITEIIESSNCTIEKEEIISNRNAVVLNYDGTEKINDQTYFTTYDFFNDIDSQVDEFNYNIKIWIDTETGLLLQTIFKINNTNTEQKTIYDLKLNTVTESDVIAPSLSQYQVYDMTSDQ